MRQNKGKPRKTQTARHLASHLSICHGERRVSTDRRRRAFHEPDGPRVLAAQRSYPPELAGRWEFPGGKVEPGEAPLNALRRELREEIGADISFQAPPCQHLPVPPPTTAVPRTPSPNTPSPRIPLLGLIEGPTGDWPLPGGRRMRLWAGYTRGEPHLGPDHLELRWLGADELESVPWLEGDVQILESLAQLMQSLG